MSKQNIILLIFLFIGLLYLLWIAFKMFQKKFCSTPLMGKTVQEHFTTEEETPSAIDDLNYSNRMNVMKVFDTVLNRKPTSAELEKYSSISNEQDLLVKVLADHKTDVVKEETEAFEGEAEASDVVESLVNVTEEAKAEMKARNNVKVVEQLSHITKAVEEIKKLML